MLSDIPHRRIVDDTISERPESDAAGLAVPFQASLADQIADSIVEGIATDVLAPGQRLIEVDICARMGVSRVPVREALTILEVQGIVESKPRRGVRVASFDQQRVDQILEARVALELIAAPAAAANFQHGSRRPEALKRVLDQMEARAAQNIWSGPDRLDISFHREICRAADNPIVATLWEAIARHIRIVFGKSVEAGSDPAFLFDEHRSLFATLTSGDKATVLAEMRKHLRPTRLRAPG